MFAVQGFRASWAIDQHFKNLTYTTASLSLLVNYPHFLISYKLAYSRGIPFIRAHWWQMVAVPILMAAVFALAFVRYDTAVANIPLLAWLADALRGWGANAQVVSGPRLGDLLFAV